jgi:hypothetical protein
MMRLFALALVLPVAATAATNSEEDGIEINRLNATDFEVIQGSGFGAAAYWCGAATFIERRSKQSELTRIYVKTPERQSLTAAGRKGVVFTTDPTGLPEMTGRHTVTVREAGATLKSVQARGFCRDAFTRATK